MGRGEYALSASGHQEAQNILDSGQERFTDLRLKPKQARNIDICSSIAAFNQFGIGWPLLENASIAANLSGRLPAEELIRSGTINRSGFASITAAHIGVDYSESGPDPTLLTGRSSELVRRSSKSSEQLFCSDFSSIVTEYCGWQQKPKIFVACEPSSRDFISKLVANDKISNRQVVLTTQKKLNFSQFTANVSYHLNTAIGGLASRFEQLSAKQVVTLPQVSMLILAIISIGLTYIYSPFWVLLGLHVIASSFYLALTLMRASMIVPGSQLVHESTPRIAKHNESNLPFYSVMVALYREAGQVDALVDSLKKINWPKDRLQILLVCEEGDTDTIAKCQHYNNEEIFQTVICPQAYPQTKPKALNFALPLAIGEFTVLYDAEDRPHRDQLREAHEKFKQADSVACLQAPLEIHNDMQSWFTRMFAIEYTTQFRLILPVLEKWQSPIPLGGTSNHFRTSVLKNIGGWDPYNVTEDADLGIRLARFGYSCGTIKHPTFEEAPPTFKVWFKQRTRWIKGWLQTLLVHMRNPMQLTRDLGLIKTAFFHLVISAIVISVLIHPFFIASSIYYVVVIAQHPQFNPMAAWMLGIDAFNLVGGYSTYFAIAWIALTAKGKIYLRGSIIWLPLYWLLISLAGWRALFQLFTNPHVWEKTEHGLCETPIDKKTL